jgi:mono/diheme cytochrome c family protein
MAGRLVALLGVLIVSWGGANAQQKPAVKTEPIPRTSPINAKEMFTNYCAACHGIAGKGDGPAALALKKAPADLTRISARNGGKFPDIQVARYIQGADEFPAHGNRDMPVWGNLFKAIGSDQSAQMRVSTLVEYLKSIQQ